MGKYPTKKEVIHTATVLFFCLFFCTQNYAALPTLPSNDELLLLLTKKVGTKIDAVVGSVEREGATMKVGYEGFLTLEGNIHQIPPILGKLEDYKKWILNGINQRRGGGSRFVLIHDLIFPSKASDMLNIIYSFSIPLFGSPRERLFRITKDTKGEVFTLCAESLTENDPVLESASACLRAFPAKDQKKNIWIYVKASAKLKSGALYALLPEKILSRELGDRMEVLLRNYQAEESRLETLQMETGPHFLPNKKPLKK
jgi:hypothetical protein